MKNLILLLLTSFFCISAGAQQLLFTDFNTGPLGQGVYNTSSSLCNPPDDGYLTDSFSTDGGRSFRAEVKKTDDSCGFSFRSEMHLPPANSIMQNAEWITWDILYPEWLGNDALPIVAGQIHGLHIVPTGLWIMNGTQLRLDVQWRTDGSTLQTKTLQLGNTYSKGKWHKIIMHYKRALDNTGIVEVWVDGVQRGAYYGPNTDLISGLPELNTLYFKFGNYKWRTPISPLDKSVVYIDNVGFYGAATTINDILTQTIPAPLPTVNSFRWPVTIVKQ